MSLTLDATSSEAIDIHILPGDAAEAFVADLPPAQGAWARAQGFAGTLGETLLLPDPSGGIAMVLFGWGDAAARARGRFHLARLPRSLPQGCYRIATAAELGAAAALAWLMGSYRFDRYAGADRPAPARLVLPEGVDKAEVETIAGAVALTSDLINIPANDMGPAELEQAVRDLGAAHGADVTATVGDALLDANFPLIHTVGRAAVPARAPRLIDLRWGRADAPTVTLVGKGVCYDTGGLNLKPGAAMGIMKKDMGGAATALGLAAMIMGLGLNLRLRLLIPAAENAVAGDAFRPGDILTARNGLTVEVNNTDAEGRLVLADALALAAEEAPQRLISLATLTGAARVALGPDLVPFYSTDQAFADALLAAAREVADPLWQMPFHDPYEPMIEPGIADLDNSPDGFFAGSITAALFLRRFTAGAQSYSHFDLYGWTPAAKPGRPKGGACQAARAIAAVLGGRQ